MLRHSLSILDPAADADGSKRSFCRASAGVPNVPGPVMWWATSWRAKWIMDLSRKRARRGGPNDRTFGKPKKQRAYGLQKREETTTRRRAASRRGSEAASEPLGWGTGMGQEKKIALAPRVHGFGWCGLADPG
ncbi:hypothetical protein ACJZ2D_016414 [Fusarium nematophilum]